MAISSLRALDRAEFGYRQAHHLLNRAGFGGTPGQVRDLAKLGLNDAVDHIVDYGELAGAPVEGDLFDPDIMRPRTREEREAARRARQDGDEVVLEQFRRERQRRQRADRRQMAEIQTWWLRRMIETPRPLEEKLTLFWHGHFATSYRAVEDSYHMFRQNQLLRAHAAGSFKALARGIVHDPAMLRYLNNNQNRRQAPNENLARELMELFTLGEGHGYTERDIREGARALTGYTFADDEFFFARRQHDEGLKVILGREGRWDGDDFVDLIFRGVTASEFICWKLYRFFVNDLPGGADDRARTVIVDLARDLRRADYALRPVLRTLFRSRHFYDEANVAAQIKSPIQLIVQAIRSLRVPARQLRTLLSAADLMGQSLFFPPSVKGWDGGRAWINTSTLFVRQNLLVYLLTGRQPDQYPWDRDRSWFDATPLVGHLADGRGEYPIDDVVVYVLRFMLGREPHRQRVETLRAFVERQGGRVDNRVLVRLLCLVTAMPEYQLC